MENITILSRIEEIESLAEVLKDNATLLLQKTATLKKELSGGSESSTLKPKISKAMQLVLDKRRSRRIKT